MGKDDNLKDIPVEQGGTKGPWVPIAPVTVRSQGGRLRLEWNAGIAWNTHALTSKRLSDLPHGGADARSRITCNPLQLIRPEFLKPPGR